MGWLWLKQTFIVLQAVIFLSLSFIICGKKTLKHFYEEIFLIQPCIILKNTYLPPEVHGWILKFYYKYLLAKKDFHITQYCCDVYDDGKSRMCLTSSECGYLQMCKRGDEDSKLLYHNTFVRLFLLPSLALFLFIEELLLLIVSKWDSDLKRLHLKALSFFTNIHVVISKTK